LKSLIKMLLHNEKIKCRFRCNFNVSATNYLLICLMKSTLLLSFVAFFIVAFGLNVNGQLPAITTFSPASGPVGTPVTITGTNFSPVAANNIVYFGAVKATVTAATSTSLTVTVPAGATYVPITVTVNGLTGYANKPFVTTFASSCKDFLPNSFAAKSGFDAASSYSSGPNNSIQVADFDGDGKPDLAIATSPFGMAFYRNTSTAGSIAFAPKVYYPTPANFQIAVGDVNGDGKLDVVTASDSIFILVNTSTLGNISFVTQKFQTQHYYGVAINDFDADGKPDIAAANPLGLVSVFRNTTSGGDVSFASKVDFPVSGSLLNLQARDLDNDNKPDLAVGYQRVSVLRNVGTTGTISFAPEVILASPGGAVMAIGDLNEDDKADIATQASVWKNNSVVGNLQFSEIVGNFSGNGEPVISDLNGDGKPDLASMVTSGGVSLFQNTGVNGDISFAPRVSYSANVSPVITTTGVAAADFDGDGKPDLVLALVSPAPLVVFRN
jgi:hypothetical protein